MTEELKLREAIQAIVATAQNAVDFAGKFDSGSDAAILYAIARYGRNALGVAEDENPLPPITLPVPDFDEYYCTDRGNEAIATARSLWARIAVARSQVGFLQGESKNARHGIATATDGYRLDQLGRQQAERHKRLTEMQRELRSLNAQMRGLGVVKLSRIEQAFMVQAEKRLPGEVYRDVKRHAIGQIRAELGKAPDWKSTLAASNTAA